MKNFLTSDVQEYALPSLPNAGKIQADTSELSYCPLDWQRRGLQQTASGYGAKLTSSYMIQLDGKFYRLYHTCYGNASSAWFIVKGRKIFVS